MASSIDRVKQSIRERLEEIEAERDQLMKALDALSSGSGAAVGGRRGRPAGSKANAGRRAAGKRAPRGQRREQVIEALRGGESGPTAIARRLGVAPAQISGLLRQLASEGVVARTAEGKWQLTAATQHEQQQADAAASAPGGDVGGNGDTPAPAPAAQGG